MKFSAKNQTFHKLHYFGFGISRNGIFFSVSALLAEMKMDVTVIFGIGRNEKRPFGCTLSPDFPLRRLLLIDDLTKTQI